MKILPGTTGTRTQGEAATWGLAYTDVSAKEAHKILTVDQYAHVVQQFELLASEVTPRLNSIVDVRAIESFFELREKGGILGKINFRAYYAVLDDKHLVVVLGCYKKEDEGATPVRIKTRMRNRLRIVIELL